MVDSSTLNLRESLRNDYYSKVKEFDEKSKCLIDVWNEFEGKFLEICQNKQFKTLTLIEFDDELLSNMYAVYFEIFGVVCCAEFSHNFETGFVQYNVVDNENKTKRQVGKPLELRPAKIISHPEIEENNGFSLENDFEIFNDYMLQLIANDISCHSESQTGLCDPLQKGKPLAPCEFF